MRRSEAKPSRAAVEAPNSRAVARIDPGAVERNSRRLLSELSGDAVLCAVVKADGYGHGAVTCARAALAGGATWLAVATAAEAGALRAELPDARLLVLGALTPEELEVTLEADADLAVWRPGFLELVRARAAALGQQGPGAHQVRHRDGQARRARPGPRCSRWPRRRPRPTRSS